MQAWHFAPTLFLAHAAAMIVDEAWYHRRRGLPRWERWGHPADTLTVLLCYVLALVLAPGRDSVAIYVAAAALSTVFVTKDEWVHAGVCSGGEMWLHAILFAMHPVLLALAGLWRFLPQLPPAAPGADAGHAFFGVFLAGQAAVTGLFLLWQILYWNGPWAPPLPATR